jgi:putative isomerase
MDRRNFIKTSGSIAGLSFLPHPMMEVVSRLMDDFTFEDHFVSANPDVIRLGQEVFSQCILGKIYPPEPPLQHPWIAPGGNYRGQWLWDTMFVVDLLSILPDKKDVIRDVFQNYWEFQTRWNEVKPDYAHDMIPCSMRPGADWENEDHLFSQIPILAWGIERVYRRNGDRRLVEESLNPLESFHEWYWRERDVTNVGLVTVGAYSGIVQDARYETYDYECNMDGLKLTRHPSRKVENEGSWYGDILVTANTSYLVLAEKSLEWLALVLGEKEMAGRRHLRISKAEKSMREHMWDEEAGTFLSVERDTLKKVPVATIGSWIPLCARIPTRVQANRMAQTLQAENWQTPLPIPTVDRMDDRYISDDFWRGDVWPATNYQVASGLADYGFRDLAADIADKTVANAIRKGISERYDSITGESLGVPYLGMTCTIITMMLDRLCKDYQLYIRI